MNTVFLDTVGLLALWDTSDQWHEAAEEVFLNVSETRPAFLTTTFVLLECGNAAARRPYRHAVGRLRERMESGRTLSPPPTRTGAKHGQPIKLSRSAVPALWITYPSSSCDALTSLTLSPTITIFARQVLRPCSELERSRKASRMPKKADAWVSCLDQPYVLSPTSIPRQVLAGLFRP